MHQRGGGGHNSERVHVDDADWKIGKTHEGQEHAQTRHADTIGKPGETQAHLTSLQPDEEIQMYMYMHIFRAICQFRNYTV